jgi:hypothetical protein
VQLYHQYTHVTTRRMNDQGLPVGSTAGTRTAGTAVVAFVNKGLEISKASQHPNRGDDLP